MVWLTQAGAGRAPESHFSGVMVRCGWLGRRMQGQLGSLEISSPDHTAALAGGLLIVNYVQFEV